VFNSWPHILQQRLSYTDSNCDGYVTHWAADTALSNTSTLLTQLYVCIYKPISKINISIFHHGIHSDNLCSGVTINCNDKLLYVTINGKFEQLYH